MGHDEPPPPKFPLPPVWPPKKKNLLLQSVTLVTTPSLWMNLPWINLVLCYVHISWDPNTMGNLWISMILVFALVRPSYTRVCLQKQLKVKLTWEHFMVWRWKHNGTRGSTTGYLGGASTTLKTALTFNWPLLATVLHVGNSPGYFATSCNYLLQIYIWLIDWLIEWFGICIYFFLYIFFHL